MRALLQRVQEAKVDIDGRPVDRIGQGLLAYVSVAESDTAEDVAFLADKLVNLRIFKDQAGKMNRSLLDVGAAVLLISNFTLHGDCRKGRRPGFDAAARPQPAQKLYEMLIERIAAQGVTVKKGIFGAHMLVSSINDGPVNFILDSSRLF